MPVYVASVEPFAAGVLVPGKIVFWPFDLLAVYKPPHQHSTTEDRDQEKEQSHRNVISSIPCGGQEDHRLNYGLQVIQLGVMLM